MKKHEINMVWIFIKTLSTTVLIMLAIAISFNKCRDKEKLRYADTISYHSDKGIVTEDNGYINIKK